MANTMRTLAQRGLVSQVSEGELAERLAEPMVLYAGFDPTASSLHIGNLLQIVLLMRFQRDGHRPIALVGGATAMIGDPSGKSEERVLLDEATIEGNLAGIRKQLGQFLDFGEGASGAKLVNNADWIGAFSFVEFLRDVGKYFRVGEMMAKESVRKRLESEAGMSFTEFSYQMLQSYDFVHLARQEGCLLQVGGDDQWGNITAGIELNRKLEGRKVYGLTSPLITTASGQKFGKTEAGTIWLDGERTSPYEFYQYWVRADDRDVIRLLKYFTFLPLAEIAELEREVEQAPEKRQAQQVLAAQMTTLVHGEEQTRRVQAAAGALFGKAISGLSDAELDTIFAEAPRTTVGRERLDGGLAVLDVLVETGLCGSRGEAKKLIKSGGAYVNNVRVGSLEETVTGESLASESIAVLRTGKKKYHLLKFE